jgi:hypothetical protein
LNSLRVVSSIRRWDVAHGCLGAVSVRFSPSQFGLSLIVRVAAMNLD